MRLKKNKHWSVLLVLILAFSFSQFVCDKYQSESYEISTVDAQGCAQLQDTLYNEIATKDLTTFNPEWTDDNVSQNVPAILDTLTANDIVVSKDEVATWVSVLEGIDTNYVCFQTTLNSVTVYSDKVVTLKLMDAQGEFLSTSNISMPMETVGGCTDEEGLPLIRTRLEYATPDDQYLLYIINQEQTFTGDDANFIIILSIQ